MNIKEFYTEFNTITSNHVSAEDTTTKLNDLLKSIEGTEINESIDINIDTIVADLEKQREDVADLQKVDEYETQEDDSYDYYDYDDSYEDSY